MNGKHTLVLSVSEIMSLNPAPHWFTDPMQLPQQSRGCRSRSDSSPAAPQDTRPHLIKAAARGEGEHVLTEELVHYWLQKDSIRLPG